MGRAFFFFFCQDQAIETKPFSFLPAHLPHPTSSATAATHTHAHPTMTDKLDKSLDDIIAEQKLSGRGGGGGGGGGYGRGPPRGGGYAPRGRGRGYGRGGHGECGRKLGGGEGGGGCDPPSRPAVARLWGPSLTSLPPHTLLPSPPRPPRPRRPPPGLWRPLRRPPCRPPRRRRRWQAGGDPRRAPCVRVQPRVAHHVARLERLHAGRGVGRLRQDHGGGGQVQGLCDRGV